MRLIPLATLLALAGTGAEAAAVCQRIEFEQGRTVALPAVSIEAINAVMEAPRPRVLSVSLRLPAAPAFSETFSLILEPRHAAASRAQMCFARQTDRPCVTVELHDDMAVTISMKGLAPVPDSLRRKLQEHVREMTMRCPMAAGKVD
jgi:hypothetical protein